MLTVEEYGVIRRAYRDGMNIRALARQFHHSRRKIREILACPEPRAYSLAQDRQAPKLGPFKATIDQILADDEQAPRKQRHTAMQVFRRLRGQEGYAGGYDQVRRYIAHRRQRHTATFIPLSHDPGQRLELDRTCAGQSQSIGQRFGLDKAAAVPLPPHAFDPCVRQPGKVDKYQTVAFDSNRYSVPRRWAFQSDGQGLHRSRQDRRRRPGHRPPPAMLWPQPPGAGPAALPGDPGPPAGGAGPQRGVSQLEVAPGLYAAASGPSTPARTPH